MPVLSIFRILFSRNPAPRNPASRIRRSRPSLLSSVTGVVALLLVLCQAGLPESFLGAQIQAPPTASPLSDDGGVASPVGGPPVVTIGVTQVGSCPCGYEISIEDAGPGPLDETYQSGIFLGRSWAVEAQAWVVNGTVVAGHAIARVSAGVPRSAAAASQDDLRIEIHHLRICNTTADLETSCRPTARVMADAQEVLSRAEIILTSGAVSFATDMEVSGTAEAMSSWRGGPSGGIGAGMGSGLGGAQIGGQISASVSLPIAEGRRIGVLDVTGTFEGSASTDGETVVIDTAVAVSAMARGTSVNAYRARGAAAVIDNAPRLDVRMQCPCVALHVEL